jgi:hypothetical protein
MRRLVDVLPELVSELVVALREEGYSEAAHELLTLRVERCTYDEEVDAGYVHLVQSEPFGPDETYVSESVCFADPHWFNVDLRVSGRVSRIELLSPSARFKAMASPYS